MAENAASSYFTALSESYGALIDAIEAQSRHGGAVWQRLVDETRASQDDALKLGKRLSEKPVDAAAYTAVLEATMKAQERSLSFAKVLFDEASTLSTEGRAAFERVVTANRSAVEAAATFGSGWVEQAPFADAWRKSVEAMTATMPGAKK